MRALGSFEKNLENILTKITPITVDDIVDIIHGIKNPVEFTDPCAIRILITVDGISCSDVAEITTSIIIFVVAYAFLPSCIEFIAFMPIGVDALPSPKRFADIFIDMYFAVVSSTPLNKKRISGRSNFAIKADAPDFSSRAKKPSQKAYIATSSIARFTEFVAPVSIAPKIPSGLLSSITTLPDIKSNNQMIFIRLYIFNDKVF